MAPFTSFREQRDLRVRRYDVEIRIHEQIVELLRRQDMPLFVGLIRDVEPDTSARGG
jgi:hypothetical protein